MVEGSHGPAVIRTPRDPRMKEGWRAAAKAFRAVYGDHSLTYNQMLDRGEAALREVMPELSEREVMLETIAAIHYASVNHPKWLYALHNPAPRQS